MIMSIRDAAQVDVLTGDTHFEVWINAFHDENRGKLLLKQRYALSVDPRSACKSVRVENPVIVPRKQ